MKTSQLYKNTLLQNVFPFWEQHSIDHQYGGYFTCLDRKGNVYDTDKFVWLQARQAWWFSFAYGQIDSNPNWLNLAENGVKFLRDKCRDTSGNFYFSVTKEGLPLTAPYNVFSDCFATMAFAEYAKVTGSKVYKDLAMETYYNIVSRQVNPKGVYEKSTGNRPLKGFALPMILSNLVMILEDVLPKKEIEQKLDECVHEVMEVFYDKKTALILEHVSLQGGFEDSFKGRLLNPGHGLEAMWFMLDIADRRKDKALAAKAIQSILSILEFGWDKKHGGLFYFMDYKGYPPEQLEWDQKLWWVHLETLVALVKAYQWQPSAEIKKWLIKIHQYTWDKFADKDGQEWFGYLNRQGEVLLDLKGGKWKGCFHVPRGLYQCWKGFEAIEKTEQFKL